MTCALRRLLVSAVLAACAAAAAGGDGAGPRFGAATISSEIRPVDGESDTDVFVESLIAGETLEVRVAAAKGSALRPWIDVLGPDDAPRDAGVRVKRGGATVQSARIPVDTTGRWTVVVSGLEGSKGGYAARFRVGPARPTRVRDVAVGGDAPASVQVPFEGVEGAEVTVVAASKRGGDVAEVLRLLAPGGGSVPGSTLAARTKGRRSVLPGVGLATGDGAYAVLLGASAGAATVSLRVSVDAAAARPRGKVAIPATEPWLVPRDEPLEGFAGRAVTLECRELQSSPAPEVRFGGKRASVVSVTSGGTRISVVPPSHPIGSVVDVEITDAAGQCTRRDTYFSYLEPETTGPPPANLAVSALTPAAVTLDGGATQVFEVTIDGDAPEGGVFVTLAATNAIGQLPSSVRVATGARTASFVFQAANVDDVGEVRATLGGATRSSGVTVHPTTGGGGGGADTLDVGGWTIVQANSTRSFTIPQGTVLPRGGYLVLARNCTQAQFEAYWGVTLGNDTVFLSSVASQTTEVPTINGSETFAAVDAFGTTQDGPSVAMASAAGQDLQRVPGGAAGSAGSWTVSTSPTTAATPGGGIAPGTTGNGVYVSEFSDAPGAGNFVYEFVELRFD